MEKSPYTRAHNALTDVATEFSASLIGVGARLLGNVDAFKNGGRNVDRARPRIGVRSGRQVNAGEQRGCGEDVHAAETEEARLRVPSPRG